MLPLDAIDYIIAHEFCHIIYMNHSKDFYALVQKIIPNYKEIVSWLKENNYKFVLWWRLFNKKYSAKNNFEKFYLNIINLNFKIKV